MFDFYPVYEENFAQVQLILFMLGMGATARQPGGLGVYLVKGIMTGGCEYERRDGKNRLTLKKRLA